MALHCAPPPDDASNRDALHDTPTPFPSMVSELLQMRDLTCRLKLQSTDGEDYTTRNDFSAKS